MPDRPTRRQIEDAARHRLMDILKTPTTYSDQTVAAALKIALGPLMRQPAGDTGDELADDQVGDELAEDLADELTEQLEAADVRNIDDDAQAMIIKAITEAYQRGLAEGQERRDGITDYDAGLKRAAKIARLFTYGEDRIPNADLIVRAIEQEAHEDYPRADLPDYVITQCNAGSLDAFIWYGERPRNIWSAQGRVTKYRKEPATIATGTIQQATPDDAESAIGILQAAARIARQLDDAYPEGVPDQTDYPAPGDVR